MFYELMMRKKTQIMYATIKGSLTENDGVFSGFSEKDYLEIQGLYDFSQPFEIKLKIKYNTDPNANGFFRIYGDDYGTYGVLLGSGNRIGFWIRDNNNNFIANAVYTPINSLSKNIDYYIKLVYTGTQYLIYISTDDINFTEYLIATNSNNIGTNKTIKIGATGGTQYFNGSIDISNSYIKLGSTKYKLQAVVGYTIVGSPTITDGVVSGFSDSNYLNILSPKSVPIEILSNNMKIKMKIKTPQQWSTSNMFLIGFNHSVSSDSATLYDGGLYITTAGNLAIHTTTINSPQPYIPLELDTIYYIEIETKGVFEMGISQDNVNWTYIQKDIYRDKWYLRNRNIRIGRAGTAIAQEFNGEIFINETSFVINNKLWFNGQQA